MLICFFHQPEKPQRPASFGTDEDFPIDSNSILSQMLKEDKSEEDKENGWCMCTGLLCQLYVGAVCTKTNGSKIADVWLVAFV